MSVMILLALLRDLPPWLTYTIVVPGLVLLTALASWAGRHLFRLSVNEERSRGALEAYKAIVSSLVFLLAFMLVQAESNLQALEKLVGQQASFLNTLDRSLLRYGSEDFTKLRETVRLLGTAIVEDEWRSLSRGDRSAVAEDMLNTLSRRIRTTDATTPRQQSLFTEMVNTLDSFSDRREELITEAAISLPAMFWDTIAALLVVLLVLASLVSPSRERVLTMMGVIAATGLVLSLVIITEAPFSGGSQVDPAPLVRAVKMMEARKP